MKMLLLVCAGLLLLGIANLPIGYYTLLRLVVTVGAVVVLATEFENGINFWVVSFALIAILFNPLFPVYLGDKVKWIPIDLITALLFLIKSATIKNNKS